MVNLPKVTRSPTDRSVGLLCRLVDRRPVDLKGHFLLGNSSSVSYLPRPTSTDGTGMVQGVSVDFSSFPSSFFFLVVGSVV